MLTQLGRQRNKEKKHKDADYKIEGEDTWFRIFRERRRERRSVLRKAEEDYEDARKERARVTLALSCRGWFSRSSLGSFFASL